jgi:hypothetical protein
MGTKPILGGILTVRSGWRTVKPRCQHQRLRRCDLVGVVGAGSDSAINPIVSRTTVPAVTPVFTNVGVPLRSQRPTRPAGRQSSSPGTMANQVCHHGLETRVDADDGSEAGASALGAEGR